MSRQCMLNIDRWLIYSRQRAIQAGNHKVGHYPPLLNMTSKQLRRCRKNQHKFDDYSTGTPPVTFGTVERIPAVNEEVLAKIGKLEVEVDSNPANHAIDCTCMMCIPGAM